MNSKKLNSQSGQAIIEAVLILAVLLGLATFISSEMKSREVVAQVISGPWESLSGVIQNGSWGSPQATGPLHPGHEINHISIKGEAP